MIYAYCRVSTPHQRLERQITNITELYPKAIIFREFYTGTTQNRPNWERLMAQIKKEDTIVFDSVSRMSRNADEGFKDYKMLYESGVNLIFLNEPLINTSVFDSTKNNLLNINIETGMLNPEIIKKDGAYDTEEGCLSLLGGPRKCKRYKTIKVKFQTLEMKTYVKNFTGWTAQIIQHEVDHCNGILI